MTNQGPGAYDEVVKMAESQLRDAVGRLGNQHPEVLKMLEQYIGILRQCGRTELADKMDIRAKALRDLLAAQKSTGSLPQASAAAADQAITAEKDRADEQDMAAVKAKADEQAKAAEEAKAAEQATADEQAKAAAEQAKATSRTAEKAKEKAEEDELMERIMASTAGTSAPAKTAAVKPEQDKRGALAQKAAKAKAAAEEGVFDLDMFEDDDEESMAMAIEILQETPVQSESVKAQTAAVAAQPTPAGDDPIFLFDSLGTHIAVAYKGGLFDPSGRVIGRYHEDFDVFLDCSGWYLGQITEDNRLTRDQAWKFRDMNFGDRGNEGNRASFGRCADIGRTCFDRGFEDVHISDD